VRIDGDVQFAGDIQWLADNLRWDIEDDLARLVGRRACTHPGQPGGQRGAGPARLSAGPRAARLVQSIGVVCGPHHPMKQFFRGATIVWVVLRFGLDELVLTSFQKPWLRLLARIVSVGRDLRAPRGQRLREALERLGPIFVKFGQVLSTRRDLMPPDIADELALLQDRVPPFDSAVAVATIERAFKRPDWRGVRAFRA
jgi:hypothetical protein